MSGVFDSTIDPFSLATPMPRSNFSAEVKQHAVALVLDDRLTVAATAQQVGCSVHALHSWLRKHRQQQNPSTPSPPTFVPITLVDPKPNGIEIVTPNGFTIRLHSPLSLGELLAAISTC